MHTAHPEAAKLNGAKGGRKTADSFVDGPKAWGVRMAAARWHGVKLHYAEQRGESISFSSKRSRAPKPGRGVEGTGRPDPRPVSATKKNTAARQERLI